MPVGRKMRDAFLILATYEYGLDYDYRTVQHGIKLPTSLGRPWIVFVVAYSVRQHGVGL
jgi:hypothetical protein